MILFVCHGNVARSQFAEALARARGLTDACSAGTNVRPEKEGVLLKDEGPIALKAVDFFREITGIDIGGKRRKRITEEMAEQADKIIVLTEGSHIPGFLSALGSKMEHWPIDDPHDFEREGYERVIGEIRRRIEGLLS